MFRTFTLILCCFSFWWVSCQNAPSTAPVSSSGLIIPITGVHSIEESTPNVRIDITVAGLEPGTAKMIGILGDQNYIADTALVDASGTVHFVRETRYPEGFYYVLLPDRSNIQMIIDANQHFSLKTQKGNLIFGMEVSDSKENDLLYKNLKFQQPLDAQIKTTATQQKNRAVDDPAYITLQKTVDSLVNLRRIHFQELADEYPKSLFTKFKLSGQNPELTFPKTADGGLDQSMQTFTFREQLWDNVDFSDPRLLRTPIIVNKINRYIKELVSQNPDSIIFATDRLLARVGDNKDYIRFIANFVPLTYRPGESALMDAEAVQVHMVKKYFTPEKAFWATPEELAALAKQASEMEASLIGKKGPDVQAKDLDGKMRSIYELTSPYIVVFMWNPECSHCKEETPQLIEFLNEWKSKGVEVYGISVNTTDAEYRRKAKEYGMTWTNVFDPTNKAIYAKYYVDNTPEIYVLNPDRTIIGKNLKVQQIATIIERDMAKRNK